MRGLLAGAAASLVALAMAAPVGAAPGDVYVVDEDTATPHGATAGAVLRIGPAGGAATIFATHAEFLNPTGMARLHDGRFVVTDYSAESLFLVDPASGQATDMGGGGLLDFPRDVAVTPDGKVLVASQDNDKVVRFDPATGQFSEFATLPVSALARSVVTTRDGGAFVSSEEAAADPVIYRLSPQGAVSVFIGGANLERPVSLTISPDERTMLLATETGNSILSIDTRTGAVSPRANPTDPMGVTLSPDGSLLVSEKSLHRLVRVPALGSTGSVFSDDPLIRWPVDTLIEPARCGGRIPTVVGTTGADVLNGSAFADVIDTLGGNDVVNGLGGNDVICGGAGRDGLRGGPGRDRLYGQAGRDKLVGGSGRDKLVGGKGKDKLKGGKGKDKEKQ
jgi:streptogramin lyase